MVWRLQLDAAGAKVVSGLPLFFFCSFLVVSFAQYLDYVGSSNSAAWFVAAAGGALIDPVPVT